MADMVLQRLKENEQVGAEETSAEREVADEE